MTNQLVCYLIQTNWFVNKDFFISVTTEDSEILMQKNTATPFVVRYAEAVIRFRWFVIAIGLALSMFAASGGQFLAFTTDYRAFFDASNPQLQAFETMQNTYDQSDNVMMVVTPKDGKVFSPKTLESVRWLTEEAWQFPYSTRVDSITNHQHTEAIEDDLNVADLVLEPSELNEGDLARIHQIAVNEPLLVNRLINPEGNVTGVNVVIQLPGESLDEIPEVASFARDLKERMEIQDPNIDIALTGMVMFNNAFGESSQNDMATLVPVMFLVVIIMLGFMLRSAWATLATVTIIFISIATAMGLFGWSGHKMTPPVASAPTIILTMAVADAVHLLVSFFWEMRHGKNKHEAMVESIRVNAMPIFITSLTTAMGFLSMNFSEVPPLAHLGNIVAVGVVVAWILSVSFLPAFTVVLPIKVKHLDKGGHTAMTALGDFVVHKRRPLMWGMLALSLMFIAFVPKNEINDEFVEYFAPSVEFRADTDYASDNLIGPYTVEYSFQSPESGGIAEPAYLATVDAFIEHLYTYEEVAHVFSLSDTMKRLNKNMHGDDESKHVLPDNRDLAAQYLLLYEMSLPYGLDLNNQIDVDKSATRVTVTTINMSTNQVLALEDSVNQWVAHNHNGIEVIAASPTLMFAHIGKRNAYSLLGGSGIALIAISIVLIFALRSLKIGLLSLIPNLLPAGIAFGIWGLISGEVGMAVSIVVGMTMGIVVDDSVHFLSKYLRARREKGFNAADACRYAFNQVGQALVVTTLVLCCGFAILALSTFRMNGDMGLVTAITIAVALVVDFFLLPPLLMWLDKEGESGDAKSENEALAAPAASTS